MKMKCINNEDSNLIINKYYEVIQIYVSMEQIYVSMELQFIEIIDENNNQTHWLLSRFKPIDQDRNDKLNQLLR